MKFAQHIDKYLLVFYTWYVYTVINAIAFSFELQAYNCLEMLTMRYWVRKQMKNTCDAKFA